MHQSDIFYKDDLATGFINSFSLGGVTGNALIVPNKHFEHIYELPREYGHRAFELLQKTAVAMKKAYGCDGITTLQCNEPAGGQHALHYHHHVMQRYADDGFMSKIVNKTPAPKEKKAEYATKLKAAFQALEDENFTG
jgi:histidine triad (HIT) family protein